MYLAFLDNNQTATVRDTLVLCATFCDNLTFLQTLSIKSTTS